MGDWEAKCNLIVTEKRDDTTTRQPDPATPRPRDPAWALVGSWALTMIAIPIVRWTIGDGVLPWGVAITVCLLTAAVLLALQQTWGGWATVRLVGIVLPLAWGLEWLGSTTGVPFGDYDYTPLLQPQIAGVPVIIPLAWLMMLPPAWAIASVITKGRRDWAFVLLSAGAFTAWDLFLDPQMVAWGYWVWEMPGGYFGIPWINFGGWFLSAILLTVIIRPPTLPYAILMTIYGTTWFLQTIGQFLFWQMPGPALAGGVGMGLFLLFAAWETGKSVDSIY